ncbi:MAG TPA: hypothetical protein VMU50_18390 [Polyangia bacterium]|nr:hypothetical protein [Polyangia bacterium]
MTVSAEDEFAHVRSSQARHPALALSAAALAFFIVFHIRHDLVYSVSPSTPVDLGDARSLFATPERAAAAANRFVQVRGTPDRQNALELDTKGSWVFSQFFQVLQTNGRLYLHRRESPLPAWRAERDVFEGRLIRFRDLSFAGAIRHYYATHVSAAHFFRPADLAAAIAGAGAAATEGVTLRDLAGDSVKLGPADLLAIDLPRPGEVRVALPRSRFSDEVAARAAIEKQGGSVVAKDTTPGDAAAAAQQAFFVRFPDGKREAALGALGDLDPRVAIREARDQIRIRLGEIGVEGRDALLVRDAQNQTARIPLASAATVRTLADVQIPDDAYLLIEADQPRQHLHAVIASALLLLFGAVNLIGLLGGIRRGRAR